MREHKYRAWAPENKVMIYFDLGKVANDHYQYGHLIQLLANKHPDGKDLLTEYIGIKDKNDKEIYEGDILKDDQWNPNTMHVVFEEGCFYMSWANAEYPVSIQYVERFEVIGNIFENPELLEATNEQ